MSRLSDFVTVYDVTGVGNTDGATGTAVPLGGPNATIALDYTNGGETNVSVGLDIGETSSGPWYTLQVGGGASGDATTSTVSATGLYSFSVNSLSAGEPISLAGPWIRPKLGVSGAAGVGTVVKILLAFSGAGR